MLLLELPPQPAPVELAIEECLLEDLESLGRGEEILRLWEVSQFAVIVGASSRITDEVDIEACHSLRIPVLRRISGGCSVTVGPGCLMYSLLLSLEKRPCLSVPQQAHQWVLRRLATALESLLGKVEVCGLSDLGYEGRKFSGNSLRRKRRYFLYHGTLLYRFPLELISWTLRMPPRQPEWRAGRDHAEFLTNIPLSRKQLHETLVQAFKAEAAWERVPWDAIINLAQEKYSSPGWNLRY